MMYSWNTTIEDTSSTLIFSPYSEGAIDGGWASNFQGLGFWAGPTGQDSMSKDSVHITIFPGASVFLQFEGTAIYLYGTQNCSYSITLDSQPVPTPIESSLPPGVLFWQENLTPNMHFIQLTAQPQANSTQQLAFDKAIFTNIGIEESTNGVTSVSINNHNMTAVHYTGHWTNSSSYNVPSDSNPGPYMSTTDVGDTASFNFTGAVAVAVNGARNWGHRWYNITLDGTTSRYNASTYWLMGDTVLFYQGNLDPHKSYTIELANTGQPGDKLSLNSFTLYTPNGTVTSSSPSSSASSEPTQGASTPHSTKTNVGVIVGPIIAGVAVILALVAAFAWLARRRGRGAPNARPEAPSEPVAPFPRTGRPELWYKGMPENPTPEMAIRVVPPILPATGKRRVNVSERAAPSASATSSDATTSNMSLVQATQETNPPPLPHPSASPATVTQPARSAAPSQTVDVDQIIELIAQRIDPTGRGSAGDSDAPPEYTDRR